MSRAHALLDEGRTLVEQRVPPALIERCKAIAKAGGLGPPPPGALTEDPPLPIPDPVARPLHSRNGQDRGGNILFNTAEDRNADR